MRKTCLSFLLLAACGGGSGTVPIDQIGTEFGAAYCAKAAECCTTMELHDLTFSDDEAGCNAFYGGLIQQYLVPVLQDSVDQGRLVYHGDVMADCVDTIDAMSCDEFAAAYGSGSGFDGCGQPFEPLVADDGTCGTDSDCVSGFCSGDSIDFQDGTITYGTCLTPPPAGQACIDFECEDGAWCDGGTCAAPQADGAECTGADECSSGGCDGYDSSTGTPGTCAAVLVCDGVS